MILAGRKYFRQYKIKSDARFYFPFRENQRLIGRPATP